MTIQEIITRKEDQTFDCKSIQIEPKALAVPIVAMANADGGVLAVGVSDKTRTLDGVDQHTEKLNELLLAATEPTASRERRYRSRCLMTGWCLSPQVNFLGR